MTAARAAKILREHNRWRRGSDDFPQPDPFIIGLAIDYAVAHLSKRRDGGGK